MPSDKRQLFRGELDGYTPAQSGNCPLCNTGNALIWVKGTGSDRSMQGWCPACTNLWINGEALEDAKEKKVDHLLIAYLRGLHSDEWAEKIRGMITVDKIKSLTSAISEPTILDQFDMALKLICEMCPVVGQPSRFHFATDWPLLVASSDQTALFILRELARAGYLHQERDSAPVPPKPTWKAYERLQQIQSSGRSSDAGFVAMSFSATQMEVWEQVISPGILAAGYRPIRVDQYEHNRRIDDEIIAQIRRCRFLVADFTEHKRGVYFEAGFALGLGRNVIWMCKQSEIEKSHFDTRQFNHILYDDLGRACSGLTNRIVALEGQGTYALQGADAPLVS
jgi:nucleoside 2-deoxyribosyltransferase